MRRLIFAWIPGRSFSKLCRASFSVACRRRWLLAVNQRPCEGGKGEKIANPTICDKIVSWLLPGQSCQSRQRGQGCFSWSAARSASVRRAREPQVSALGARSLPERGSLLICLFATSSWNLWKIDLTNLKFNSRVSQKSKTTENQTSRRVWRRKRRKIYEEGKITTTNRPDWGGNAFKVLFVFQALYLLFSNFAFCTFTQHLFRKLLSKQLSSHAF